MVPWSSPLQPVQAASPAQSYSKSCKLTGSDTQATSPKHMQRQRQWQLTLSRVSRSCWLQRSIPSPQHIPFPPWATYSVLEHPLHLITRRQRSLVTRILQTPVGGARLVPPHVWQDLTEKDLVHLMHGEQYSEHQAAHTNCRAPAVFRLKLSLGWSLSLPSPAE